MKIIFLTPTLKSTGGNIVLKTHAEYLHNRRHEVIVLGFYEDDGLFHDCGFQVIPVKTTIPRKIHLIFFDIFLVRKLLRYINYCDIMIPVFTPLLVHAHFAKVKNKCHKIVHLYQDALEFAYFGPYIKFILQNKMIQKTVDVVLAISNALGEYAKKKGFMDVRVVQNGIDLSVFRAQKANVNERRIDVLFVGGKKKGLGMFKKIVLLSHNLGYKFSFVLITSDRVDISSLRNTVVYTKTQNREQMAEFYNSAKVYLSLSRIESFGLPALEAMACGAAVVAVKNSGNIEYADKSNCVLIEEYNTDVILNSIKTLLESPNDLQQFTIAGKETSKKFKLENMTEKMSRILASMDVNNA